MIYRNSGSQSPNLLARMEENYINMNTTRRAKDMMLFKS